MKGKVALLLAASAIITLSFTFSSGSEVRHEKEKTAQPVEKSDQTPIGGFMSEDQL